MFLIYFLNVFAIFGSGHLNIMTGIHASAQRIAPEHCTSLTFGVRLLVHTARSQRALSIRLSKQGLSEASTVCAWEQGELAGACGDEPPFLTMALSP